jgi:hypothetical protein
MNVDNVRGQVLKQGLQIIIESALVQALAPSCRKQSSDDPSREGRRVRSYETARIPDVLLSIGNSNKARDFLPRINQALGQAAGGNGRAALGFCVRKHHNVHI